MLGECDNRERITERSNRTPYKWNSGLGVETQKKNPRKIRMPRSSSDEYVTKGEFYEGLEDAEMKGQADDPSAGDIYNEFNR